MTNADLIQALATVPVKSLRILELARELAGPGGIDLAACAPRMAEIKQATEEAHAYIEETRCLIRSLESILGR